MQLHLQTQIVFQTSSFEVRREKGKGRSRNKRAMWILFHGPKESIAFMALQEERMIWNEIHYYYQERVNWSQITVNCCLTTFPYVSPFFFPLFLEFYHAMVSQGDWDLQMKNQNNAFREAQSCFSNLHSNLLSIWLQWWTSDKSGKNGHCCITSHFSSLWRKKTLVGETDF